LLGYTHLIAERCIEPSDGRRLRDGVPLDSPAQLAALAEAARIDLVPRGGKLHVLLDGEDITDLIRTREVSHARPWLPWVPGVRHPMVAEQRGQARTAHRHGRPRHRTAVFPHADLKVF